MSGADGIEALTGLGFTDLEARIYAFLVSDSPATGYRVAQAIGKPAANTYKAIESLERKGAVIVEAGSNRQCRAVPYEDVFDRLSREFSRKRERAAKALRKLGQPKHDERSYPMRTRDHVIERANLSLAEAEQVALVAVFPSLLGAIRDELLAAAARGVDVVVITHEALAIEGAEVVVADRPRNAVAKWPGEELRLAVDGNQCLLAIVEPDGSSPNAVWTRSPFMSLTVHGGLAAEACMLALRDRINEDASQKRLLKTLGQYRDPLQSRGSDAFLGETPTA